MCLSLRTMIHTLLFTVKHKTATLRASDTRRLRRGGRAQNIPHAEFAEYAKAAARHEPHAEGAEDAEDLRDSTTSTMPTKPTNPPSCGISDFRPAARRLIRDFASVSVRRPLPPRWGFRENPTRGRASPRNCRENPKTRHPETPASIGNIAYGSSGS